MTVQGAAWESLRPALGRLDHRLARAIAAAQTLDGQVGADPFRGFYLRQADVEQLLARAPGDSPLQFAGQRPGALTDGLPADSRLACLGRAFGLSAFELDLLLIALAPEFDLRYERLYAYLQDDVTRRRPTVDLALSLLCDSAESRLARWVHLAADAPLIRHHLLHLVADPQQAHPPLLAHCLKPDEPVVEWLLGQPGLDARLARCGDLIPPGAQRAVWPLGTEVKQGLRRLARRAQETGRPLRLYFHGPGGSGKRRAAEALADEVGAGLLAVDLGRAGAAHADFEQVLSLALRTARIADAVLLLDGLDALRGDDRADAWGHLLATLAGAGGITILSGVETSVPGGLGRLGVIPVAFPLPDFATRRACWQAELAAAGMTLAGPDLDALAGRFRLTPGQVADAVAAARNQARWRAAARPPDESPGRCAGQPTPSDLLAAARAQSNQKLSQVAQKLEPKYAWGDIVLPPEPLAQLRGIISSVELRHVVYEAWGFERKLSLGRGLNALFAGPSGTGKTMAAEVIARELALDLYKIDLAQVVSKYIGETEKNLDRVFHEAETSNAILFFDEADALFGRRSEVRDAHDRYANIEVGYLLQKMEEYAGVAILATNLRANLDEAFARRMHFTVEFPFPDEEHRYRIWRGIFPPETPLADDVDLANLARSLKLSGGNIKNIALAAAFLAAEEGGRVGLEHLLRAAKRELQKVGQAWDEAGVR